MISLDLAFVFQFVNFLVLMLVLNIFLYRPVRRVLSERQAEIDSAHGRAAEVDTQVQQKMALYEAKLREIKAKAHEERIIALQKAREEETLILEKARREAADSLASVQRHIAGEATEARQFLREQAQTLSLEISEKVLGRSLRK